MISPDQLQQVRDLTESAASVAVVMPAQPSIDVLCAASGLAVALQEADKQVTFVTPEPLRLAGSLTSALSGLERLGTDLGNRNLVISFDYDETAVDKVSYHIGEETGKFFLTIKPQVGQSPLSTDSVDFSYTGTDAGVIFLVGVSDLESLEQLYYGNEQVFADVPVVSFHNYETSVGQIRLDTSGSDSLSSAMAGLLRDLGWTISNEAATNLLYGVEEATHSFSSLSATPETFERVAWLMRAGARRVRRPKEGTTVSSVTGGAANVPGQGDAGNFAEVFSKKARGEQVVTSMIEPTAEPLVEPALEIDSEEVPIEAYEDAGESGKLYQQAANPQKSVKNNKYKKSKKQRSGGLDHQPGMMSGAR